MTPLLVFTRTFETVIEIGDYKIPIHVKRLTKGELETLSEGWDKLIAFPRGGTSVPEKTATEAEKLAYINAESERLATFNREFDKERFAYFTEALNYVSLDEGIIEDSGRPVVDGVGLLRIFHGRRDVLREFVACIIAMNRLTAICTKNLNSPLASASGSKASILTSGEPHTGVEQEQTAGHAADSVTAADGDATESRENDPSGPTRQVH